MKVIPILFSTPMVQALLEERKLMTRRIVKPPISNWISDNNIDSEYGKSLLNQCKYGKVGDVLWVRETFHNSINPNEFVYKADCDNPLYSEVKWKPSLFMPKNACRIFLEITDVRVERLNDISEEDCISEGIEFIDKETPYTFGYKLYSKHSIGDVLGRKAVTGTGYESFKSLWQSINGEQSWEDNPWVWVIEFKRIDKPVDFK